MLFKKIKKWGLVYQTKFLRASKLGNIIHVMPITRCYVELGMSPRGEPSKCYQEASSECYVELRVLSRGEPPPKTLCRAQNITQRRAQNIMSSPQGIIKRRALRMLCRAQNIIQRRAPKTLPRGELRMLCRALRMLSRGEPSGHYLEASPQNVTQRRALKT